VLTFVTSHLDIYNIRTAPIDTVLYISVIVFYTQRRKLTVFYSWLIHDCTYLTFLKTFLTKILSEPKVSKSLYIL